MIDISAVHRALRNQALNSAAWAALNTAGRIAYENTAFEAPTSGVWGRETLLIASERGVAIGTRPMVQSLGQIIFEVMTLKGSGETVAHALLTELTDAFYPGTGVSVGGGVTAMVERCERLSGSDFGGNGRDSDGTWYAYGVAVEWRLETSS